MKFKELIHRITYSVIEDNKNLNEIAEKYGNEQGYTLQEVLELAEPIINEYNLERKKEIYGISKKGLSIDTLKPYTKLYSTDDTLKSRYNGREFLLLRTAESSEVSKMDAPKFKILFEDGTSILANIGEVFDTRRIFADNVINFDDFIF